MDTLYAHRHTALCVKSQFKTVIIRKLTFLLAGSQWEIYEKLTKIRRLHGIVTRVLYTQFT